MSSYEEPPSPLSAASSGPPPPALNNNGPAPAAATAPPPASSSARVLRQSARGSDPEVLEARDLEHHRDSSPRHFLPCDPTKWNVEEVSEFIRSLPGQWGFWGSVVGWRF